MANNALDKALERIQKDEGKMPSRKQPETKTGQAPSDAYVPNPDLRDNDDVRVPAFPVEIFPQRLRGVVEDCERFMSYPSDITAASILAAVAIAIARTHRVYYQGEWRETACLYMAIVAPPGSAKSHPLKFALQPIIEVNKKAIKDYAYAQAQLTEQGLAGNLTDKQCLFSDFTIEALSRSIERNKRGISVYIDELRAWFQNFNRYNSGSEQEFWLQNFSGLSMSFTRATKKIWLEWPAISVVGTIQPSMLEDIGKGGRAQNGFSERILFVFPDHVPVLHLKKRNERSDTRSIFQRHYAPIIQTILDWKMEIEGSLTEEAESHELVFESTADDLITDYINDLKRRMDAIDNEYVRNVYSKMQTYSLRFCLIINRIDYAVICNDNRDFPPNDDKTITAAQVERAKKLTEYFLLHAQKANSFINANTPIAKLPKDMLQFYRSLPMGEAFSTSYAESFAAKSGISRATMFRYLSETDPAKKIFAKVKHGEWERLYV